MAPAPAPQAPARRVHRLELELQQPVPRRTAPTKGVRVLGWVTLALVAVALIGLATGQVTFAGKASGLPLLMRFSVFVGGIALPFWLLMQSSYWFSRRLVRIGTATVGVMEDPPAPGVLDAMDSIAAIGRPGQGGKTQRIAYRYRVGPDGWRRTSRRIQSWKVGEWGQPGATVTVLYDPASPERHAFYPLLKLHVVVRPRAGTTVNGY